MNILKLAALAIGFVWFGYIRPNRKAVLKIRDELRRLP